MGFQLRMFVGGLGLCLFIVGCGGSGASTDNRGEDAISGGLTLSLSQDDRLVPHSTEGLRGFVTLTAALPASSGAVQRVEFFVDGNPESIVDQAPYTYSWDSSSVVDGPHQLSAVAYGSTEDKSLGTDRVSATIQNASGGTVLASFEVQEISTFYGQDVYLVGDAPELGQWDPSKGVLLTSAAPGDWSGSVDLPEGTEVAFKFVIQDATGNVTWEGTPNRTLQLPSADGMVVGYVGAWDQAPSDPGTEGSTPPLPGSDGGVGPGGGAVDHLYFAVVGDTRPAFPIIASYPTPVIEKIYADIEGMTPRPQFVVATGDYMYALGDERAAAQIGLYRQAAQQFSGTLFPAMGNHECHGLTWLNCNVKSPTQELSAFMQGLLAPLGQSLPYYSIPFQAPDGSWTANMIFTACNVWDDTQKSWLIDQLAQPATYTLVVRHEPKGVSSPCTQDLDAALAANPPDLVLAGHRHLYQVSGNEVIVGIGGAPRAANVPFGYATVEQTAEGFTINQYDYATALPISTATLPFKSAHAVR